MNIAIIGTGNVGGALATNWSSKGHQIHLGVNNIEQFKGVALLKNKNTSVSSIVEAVAKSEIVKCFNTTGFENMLNPIYNGEKIDMFMAGDSEKAKEVAKQLAMDAGFGSCVDFGKSDKVELLEKFALSWINLAIMQGMGRNIAFKLLRR